VAPGIEDDLSFPLPPTDQRETAAYPSSSADGDNARVVPVPGAVAISQLQWRHPARVTGRVKTLRVQPWSGVPTLQCVLVDGSGEAITLVFLGRRSIPGIHSGTRMVAEAMVGKHDGKLAMINPTYELTSVPEHSHGD
jgi:hypothetical protein